MGTREPSVSHPYVRESHAEEALRESHVTWAPASQPLPFDAFGLTDIGCARDGNEDSFAVLPELGMFLVADGMGGYAAGEVASEMTIDSVREMFERVDTTWPSVDTTWPAAAGPPSSRLPGARLLIAGLQRANGRILDIARRDPAKQGMGTTFAGLLALRDRIVIAHVGDSRVYRLRGRQLTQMTEDHSLLNEMIRAGQWDPAEADSFPRRNVITRAVGTEEALEVDTRIDAPAPGDVYLLCSDGLSEMVPHAELTSILLQYSDLTQAATRLIEAANDHGGLDNITAVLVRCRGGSTEPSSSQVPPR
jgi:serine/threonine protein phosphatase PrpC